jgi:hypothetical protein
MLLLQIKKVVNNLWSTRWKLHKKTRFINKLQPGSSKYHPWQPKFLQVGLDVVFPSKEEFQGASPVWLDIGLDADLPQPSGTWNARN